MTPPAASLGIATYGIGEKMRALRLKRKLSLVELGRHTGLSAALLSKLERNRMVPTLQTLLRVALAHGVGLDYFFAASAPRRAVGVVRATERQSFVEKLGGREVAWEFECLDFTATERVTNAYKVRFHGARPRPRAHEHAGAEFLHVLSGRVMVSIAGEEHMLGPGDSMYFDSAQPHAYRRLGSRPAEAIVVTAGG